MEFAFFFYSGMTALDVIGPHEILCRLPSATIRRVATQPGTVKTDSGVELIADYGFNEVPRADWQSNMIPLPRSIPARLTKHRIRSSRGSQPAFGQTFNTLKRIRSPLGEVHESNGMGKKDRRSVTRLQATLA
jgi:hypothetical protein